MPLTVTYLGHSGFLFDDGHDRGRLCVDPFLTGNPKATLTPGGVDCDYVAFTHGHADHFNPDGWSIAQRCRATCIANFEIGQYLLERVGLEDCLRGNPGGSVPTAFGHVAFTPAIHSSSYEGTYLGVACGFVLHFERVGHHGVTVYHAGDTALFGDMKLIGDLALPDLALLPADGRFTMSAKLAGMAAELIRPKLAVPIHWGTFESLAQHVDDFQPKGVPRRVMRPGECIMLGD